MIGNSKKNISTNLIGSIRGLIKGRAYLILLIPSFVVLFIFFNIPLIFLFILSLRQYIPGKGISSHFTPDMYVKFATDFFYISSLIKTLLLGILITFLTLIIGYPLARTTSKQKGFLVALVIFPLFLNIVVRSFAWVILLAKKGIINNFLIGFHIIGEPLDLLFNDTGVVIGMTHILLPFMVIALASIIQNIERDYEEAAYVLGASKFKAFLKITLPLSLPGIIAGSLLVFLQAITAFVTPRLLGGINIRLISNLIYQEFTNTFNWPFGASMGFILLLVTLLIIYAYLKVFSMGEK
jgi:putative spermidine/putrescine transport system permease protein